MNQLRKIQTFRAILAFCGLETWRKAKMRPHVIYLKQDPIQGVFLIMVKNLRDDRGSLDKQLLP